MEEGRCCVVSSRDVVLGPGADGLVPSAWVAWHGMAWLPVRTGSRPGETLEVGWGLCAKARKVVGW